VHKTGQEAEVDGYSNYFFHEGYDVYTKLKSGTRWDEHLRLFALVERSNVKCYW
jgi:hypothetical protein